MRRRLFHQFIIRRLLHERVRTATTIVGVAHKEFDTPHGADFWFGQQLDKDDINHFFDGYMRLKPGATLVTGVQPVASSIADEDPARVLEAIARELDVPVLRPGRQAQRADAGVR